MAGNFWVTMTTIETREVVCSICGVKSQHHDLTSSGEYGYRDLDLRPSEMFRSTMNMWLQECPSCGLVAPDLENSEPSDQVALVSDDYMRARSNRLMSPLARRFLCRAIIEAENNRPEVAFSQTLSAAWVCDDAKQPADARILRLKAAAHLDGRWSLLQENRKLQLVDVLRRARRWAEADALMNSLESTKLDEAKIGPGVVSLQRLLIGRRDDACYSVKDALSPGPPTTKFPPTTKLMTRLRVWLGL